MTVKAMGKRVLSLLFVSFLLASVPVAFQFLLKTQRTYVHLVFLSYTASLTVTLTSSLPPGKCGLPSRTTSAQGFPKTSEYP